MTEHKHEVTDIKGYRTLSPDEISLINSMKSNEARMLEEIDDMERRVKRGSGEAYNLRSLALARTKFQEGFMWLVRAVARPNGE